MAKKGGVQQLQADISTDEDLEKFLERPGLIVMDVYTEWCGPCLGMIGSLKKIKLELGGDNLQLAICKSDSIEALKRFRNKSEPTWLFASHQKAVNIMFGTNVPKLMKLIAKELELEHAYAARKVERTFYDISERQPMELEKYNLVKAAEDQARLAELHAAEAKRREYLMFVTNEIMQHMPDMGVTIFGPHIQRDMYKKLMDPADAQKISCKDRRVLQVTKEDLDILHFSCKNPLPEEVWEYMLDKDLLACLWKANESDTRPIDEILAKYVYECTKPTPMFDDFGNIVAGKTLPPVLPSLEIKIASETDAKQKHEEGDVEDDNASDVLGGLLGATEPIEEDEEEQEEENPDEQEEVVVPEKLTTEKVEATEAPKQEEKILQIPAVWAPGNRRTIAAAIYVFFRWHTGTFLPPDPVPEPPHLAIAFEAYKRKDIADVCERFKEDILAYGFFTTTDPDSAQLITNSIKRYDAQPPQVTDKFVLKVAKKTSHALLTLATHGPCYISTNTVVGEKECKKFFPADYLTEGDAIQKVEEGKKKKKKKKTAESGAAEVAPEVSEEFGIATREESLEQEGTGNIEFQSKENVPLAEGDAEAEITVAKDEQTEDPADATPEEDAPVTVPEDQSAPPSAPSELPSPTPDSSEPTSADKPSPDASAEKPQSVTGDEGQTEGEGEEATVEPPTAEAE